ncbi:CheR family methyltransferase [Accumulibacter sp.]|uniref:CheR family methyltransferase n=1 Tax=Accumulibacter sp. TaxID=2053492 RepID=UPI00262FDE01|nr:CheR family methyltransferase [Accumulibacter sp.]
MSRRVQLNQRFFDLPILRGLGRSIHARRIASQARSQSTATRFFRNLRQLEALQGPLAELADGRAPLRILVAGCSFGCEAYSLAGFLAVRFPQLEWTIDAFDISRGAVAIAQRAVFGRKHGLADGFASDVQPYAERMFERRGEEWAIVADIRQRVRVSHGDLLAEDFVADGAHDIVFAQNFLVHMDDKTAGQAFARIVATVKAGGALFVGGMNLDSKAELIKRHRLIPVDWQLEAIHDSDDMRRSAWPWDYWTLEPIDRSRPDFTTRYSTIFRIPDGA